MQLSSSVTHLSRTHFQFLAGMNQHLNAISLTLLSSNALSHCVTCLPLSSNRLTIAVERVLADPSNSISLGFRNSMQCPTLMEHSPAPITSPTPTIFPWVMVVSNCIRTNRLHITYQVVMTSGPISTIWAMVQPTHLEISQDCTSTRCNWIPYWGNFICYEHSSPRSLWYILDILT